MNFDLEINQDVTENESTYFTTDDFNAAFNLNNDGHNQQSLSLLHINARSMNKNFDSMDLFFSSIQHFPFSIIGITETWLNNKSPPLFNIENYKLIRADRSYGRGGGVALYIHDSLTFKERPDLSVDGSEYIFIEIINKQAKNILVGVMYRPPHSNIDMFVDRLEESLSLISRENKIIYLMGDYNINLLPHALNNIGLRLLTTLSSYSLHPHINKATRITSITETLIDNIFSNIFNENSQNGILYSDISDHLPIFVISPTIQLLKHESMKYIYIRKETDANIQSFRADLLSESWVDVFNLVVANDAYDIFLNKLMYYYNKNIPLVRIKLNKNKAKKPWTTRGILRSIATSNRLYKKALRSKDDIDLNKYKKYRNKLTSIIRLSRKLYYSNKIASTQNNNSLWNIIKDLTGKKKHINTTINVNGQDINNLNECANYFNKYFVDVCPTLASKIDAGNNHFSQYLLEPSENSLFFTPTTIHEVISIVQSLKSSKSSGPDGLSMNLIKQIIHFIVSPLVHICNISLSTGSCPNLLKIAKVIPIHKKDDPSKLQNYRPISLLSSISKVFEKLVYKRLISFLNEHDILIPNQFGFRKNHSTDFALIKLCDKIIESLANKKHVIGVFMDLSKAFDTIDHTILLYKLEHYGIRGLALSWFEDYLKNRTQYVYYHSNSSSKLNLTCGVPQGSILGPLLFLIYVNDIIKSSNTLTYILFADDTNILYSHKNIDTLVDTVNHDLCNISIWFKCNKLSLNISKTNFIHFRTINSQDQPQCNFLCLRHRRWCRRHHVFGLSVRTSVRPYVRPSVRPSVRPV